MHTMYSNLARVQVFPLVIRVSSKPRCFKPFYTLKPQSLPSGFHPKPPQNPICVHFTTVSKEFDHKSNQSLKLVRATKTCTGFQCKSSEMSNIVRTSRISGGFRVKSALCWCSMLRVRSFSSLQSQRVGEETHAVRVVKSFPWLSSNKVNEDKRLEKGAGATSSRSSWEKSVKRLEKTRNSSFRKESMKRLEKGTVTKTSFSSWEESAKGLEKAAVTETAQPSWESGADLRKNSTYMMGNKETRSRISGTVKDREIGYSCNGRVDNVEEGGQGEEEVEAVDDPRWYKIKNRLGMVSEKGKTEKPQVQRWNKQENWGRMTWKEATEKTLPKMVGEGVYGVGPVLAALSAGRREFYALYAQEGLDLSGNNRKKKDKRAFEKVLRKAENVGLSIKEVSKHDLNMIANNRPHQGLMLDASPLEMVEVKELDPVIPEEGKGSLWVALDEITDPQNLGAIIRSAYFFGASGVVLCAKNSAPLSGVVSKASAGSLEVMELRYCKNMMQFLVSSAENGWRVLGGSVSSKAVPLNEVLPGEPTILVLGSEGTGLRPLVERSCTQLIRIPGKIPMDATIGDGDDLEAEETNLECSSKEFHSFLAVESLNVSVATGVLLHHLIGRPQQQLMRRPSKF